MISFERVRGKIDGHRLVRSIDRVERGHVRLETIFLYPDGSSVDVFVPDTDPLLPPSKISDLGQTMAWLMDVQVKPWMSKKRQRILEDAIRLYGVNLNGGALETSLPSMDALVDGVVRLGQACVRVADLTYTRRTSLQAGVTEEVEEILADAELAYEAGVELEGKFNAPVRVDFLVSGKTLRSAVLAMSSANSSQAHQVANEIFRKWYDLDTPARPEHRVTVFDDRYDTYRAEDLARLRDRSDVIALSDRQTLIDLLAA